MFECVLQLILIILYSHVSQTLLGHYCSIFNWIWLVKYWQMTIKSLRSPLLEYQFPTIPIYKLLSIVV